MNYLKLYCSSLGDTYTVTKYLDIQTDFVKPIQQYYTMERKDNPQLSACHEGT